MTLTLAIRAFELLLGWSLLQQTLEYLRLPALDRISHWPTQRSELPARPAWLQPLLDRLLTPAAYRGLLLLRGALALALMAGLLRGTAGLAGALLLFGIALVLLFRWRGAFNGGSDFMTLVGLTGLLIAHIVAAASDPALGWRAGLWYVALQSLTSYFVSGWVKLLRPEWRNGRALPVFLDSGIYGPIPPGSIYRAPVLARGVAWSFTVWEGLFPLALLDVRLALFFCASGAVFHFLVFWYFGLNRFLWAWLATYPAVLYCALA
jgi:hypothetical protein